MPLYVSCMICMVNNIEIEYITYIEKSLMLIFVTKAPS